MQVIESRALSLDIDDQEDLILLCEHLASPGSGVEPALVAWLKRHGSRAVPRAEVLERVGCA